LKQHYDCTMILVYMANMFVSTYMSV